MRRLILKKPASVERELDQIGIDSGALPIFKKKARSTILKFENVTCAQANVLKQIALVCGADLAIPRHAYRDNKHKHVSAILFANQREIEKMCTRLDEQPWLRPIKQELESVCSHQGAPVVTLGRKKLTFNRTYIMGVINVTPDSFYAGSRYRTKEKIERTVCEMEEAGADFIEIGAESSRPGSRAVSAKEQIRRLKPVLAAIVKKTRLPVSIDTYKADVVDFAIKNGGRIINDISGLRFDKRTINVLARSKVGVVIMHMQGRPRNMQVNPSYRDLMHELHLFFQKRIACAIERGIERERLILDPGLGFGKRLEDNYEIIERFAELSVFGRPLMAGHSRKSFIGVPFQLPPEERLEGTLGLSALLINNGASILRVHDVRETKRVALLIDRMKA